MNIFSGKEIPKKIVVKHDGYTLTVKPITRAKEFHLGVAQRGDLFGIVTLKGPGVNVQIGSFVLWWLSLKNLLVLANLSGGGTCSANEALPAAIEAKYLKKVNSKIVQDLLNKALSEI
jgi:hypothetical protein